MRACLALCAGLAPLLGALPARAEPFQVAGGGAFLGYAFGEGGGFEWGIEGFATRHFKDHPSCGDSSARQGFGPLLRLSMVKASRLELTAALHGGGELPGTRSFFAIDGEFGASLFLQKGAEPRVAPHTGVTFESILFNLYFRHEWLTPAFSVGGGARYFPTFGEPGFCEVGRAYRGDCGQALHAGVRAAAGFDARDAGAARWARRAAEECASVPAFLQLAIELTELGAPLELVERAVQAAAEELGHTVAAARLAQAFGGAPLALSPPPFEARRRLPRAQALRRLVAESWRDGCLNEALACAVAAEEARETTVAEEAATSRLLAREEAGHATLAFDVLRWALAELPDRAPRLRRPSQPEPGQADASFLKRSTLVELSRATARTAHARLAELAV